DDALLCTDTVSGRSSITIPSVALSTCFFSNDPAPTEIYTLSLHDALPISTHKAEVDHVEHHGDQQAEDAYDDSHCNLCRHQKERDRKSTRLNSSHLVISYAVFCLKKKNKPTTQAPHYK